MLILLPGHLVLLVWGQDHKWGQGHAKVRSFQGQVVSLAFYCQAGGGPSTERHSSFYQNIMQICFFK